MGKQPEIETLLVGYNEKHKLNKNFEAISSKFREMLSRSGEQPNHMLVDLDLADATITNVNRLVVNSLQVIDENFTGLADQYIFLLAQLSCTATGSLLTHGEVGEPICLPIGSPDEALKVSGVRPSWDEDTDTIGVTVQEDGVTVAENVRTIDFKWTNVNFPTLVTTPASDQVDLALDDVFESTLVALWEDTRDTSDLNINPDGPSAVAFNDPNEVNRLDLVNDVGIAIPDEDAEYYVIMETSSRLESNGSPDNGSWTQGVRFYDNTGTSTPLTGVQLSATESGGSGTEDLVSTTAGGSLMTNYSPIPAGTRYIDFGKGDAFLFPLFVTTATVDNRYRAVVAARAVTNGFTSPNDVAYPGGLDDSVTT